MDELARELGVMQICANFFPEGDLPPQAAAILSSSSAYLENADTFLHVSADGTGYGLFRGTPCAKDSRSKPNCGAHPSRALRSGRLRKAPRSNWASTGERTNQSAWRSGRCCTRTMLWLTGSVPYSDGQR